MGLIGGISFVTCLSNKLPHQKIIMWPPFLSPVNFVIKRFFVTCLYLSSQLRHRKIFCELFISVESTSSSKDYFVIHLSVQSTSSSKDFFDPFICWVNFIIKILFCDPFICVVKVHHQKVVWPRLKPGSLNGTFAPPCLWLPPWVKFNQPCIYCMPGWSWHRQPRHFLCVLSCM